MAPAATTENPRDLVTAKIYVDRYRPLVHTYCVLKMHTAKRVHIPATCHILIYGVFQKSSKVHIFILKKKIQVG